MASYRSPADLPELVPVFPLDGALLLPRGQLPLNIFEPRYLNMVDDAMGGERIIGMVQTRSGGTKAKPALCRVGCAGRITSYAETSDGRYLLTLTGVMRFRLGEELGAPSPYRQFRAAFEPFALDLDPPDEAELEGGRAELMSRLKAYLDGRGLEIDWDQAKEAPMEAFANSLAMALPFEPAEKQALLEALMPVERLNILTALLQMGAATSKLGEEGDDHTPMH